MKEKHNEKITNRNIDVPKYFEENDPRFMENPFAGFEGSK